MRESVYESVYMREGVKEGVSIEFLRVQKYRVIQHVPNWIISI